MFAIRSVGSQVRELSQQAWKLLVQIRAGDGRLLEGMSLGKNRTETVSDAAAAAAKSLQSCQTLCDPTDGSPPGSPIPGILQARTLEWVAISFSSAWKWKVKVKSLTHVWLLATPWTAAYQAPPSMGFSRQEYWSGCYCLLPYQMLNWKQKLSSGFFTMFLSV